MYKVASIEQLRDIVLQRIVDELVSKDLTIADISLNDNISAASLLTALGIESGANKTTVDTALSTTSTNPVQNKVVASSVNTLTTSVSTVSSDLSTLESSLGTSAKVDYTTSVTSGSSKLVTSGGVYTAVSGVSSDVSDVSDRVTALEEEVDLTVTISADEPTTTNVLWFEPV